MCRYYWHCAYTPPHHHDPWHCSLCKEQAKALGIYSITLDKAMVTYPATGALPTDPIIHPHIMKAALKLYCDPRGVLWAKGKEGHPTQSILLIGERYALIYKAIMNLAYPTGKWLYQYLGE